MGRDQSKFLLHLIVGSTLSLPTNECKKDKSVFFNKNRGFPPTDEVAKHASYVASWLADTTVSKRVRSQQSWATEIKKVGMKREDTSTTPPHYAINESIRSAFFSCCMKTKNFGRKC